MVPDVTLQFMGFNTTRDLWKVIQDLFGVQSRVEEDFLHQTFYTTRKDNYTMEDYLRIMKTNTDNLSQAGSPVPPRSSISQVLLLMVN